MRVCHYPNCGKEFVGKKDLTDHINTKHLGIRFSCHMCDKTYESRSGLNKHLLRPHDERPLSPLPAPASPLEQPSPTPPGPQPSTSSAQHPERQPSTPSPSPPESQPEQSTSSANHPEPQLSTNQPNMAGRGRGRKGLGKGGAKRNRKMLRDNIQGVTKTAIRRLARRGGVKRISGLIYEEIRGALRVFLENVISDAITYTEYAHRKTITVNDVTYALKQQGRNLY